MDREQHGFITYKDVLEASSLLIDKICKGGD